MSTAAQVPDFIPAEQPDFIPANPAPQLTQFEQERAPANREGFLRAAWNTVKSIPGGIISAANDPFGAAIQTGTNLISNDAHRKAEGRSGAYRAIAGLGDILGVDSRGMEDAADRGDVTGVLGHAAGSAAPYVLPVAGEGAIKGVRATARASRVPLGKAAVFASDVVNPEVTGIVSPRAAHVQRVLGRVGNAMLTKKPAIDALSEAASEAKPIDALSEAAMGRGPIEGEYVEPKASAIPVTPRAPVLARTDRTLPEAGSPGINAGAYGYGPGVIEPEMVGEPNRSILAGGKGVISRPPKQLKPAQPFRRMTAENIDDAAVNQRMAEDLESHGRRANHEEAVDFAEKNSADIPKWKRLAQFRAQMAAENVLREAELAQQIPARMTKTRVPKAPATRQDILNPGEQDLTPILEESLKQARARKGPPKAEK